MRYIHSKLLCHTITVRTVTEMDEDRNPVYTESTVSGVRIGLTRSRIQGSEGFETADVMEMFSDSHTTAPSDFVPAVGMQIVFNERTYTVKSVKACYGASVEVHHYEAELA